MMDHSPKESAIFVVRRENVLSFINGEFRLINAFGISIILFIVRLLVSRIRKYINIVL